MRQKKLFTPGPVEVPWQVLQKLSEPLIHHRTEEFRAVHLQTVRNLQTIMKTTNPVVVLTASGSGAMEASVVNLTKPGEKALVIEIGKFSERWRELGEAFGLDLVVLEGKWGEPMDPARVQQAFDENPDIDIVFATHSETSTGVLQDVQKFSEIAHANNALIVIDGITSVGCHDVRVDEWQLDIVVGGSQKGVATPPGISYLSISGAARERIERGRHPVYYFDLARALKSLEKGDTPWTPAHTLMMAMNVALDMLVAEGIDNVVKRHARNAHACREGVRAMGLDLYATVPSNATTAVLPPDGTAGTIKQHMETAYGLKIAGGQGEIKGKIFRLGHLGFYYEADVMQMMAALEATLKDLGIRDSIGAGAAAVAKAFEEA